MSYNKRMKILFLALVFCCCLVSVGYFTLINAMVVEGNIKVKPAVWDVSFSNIKTVNTIGSAKNYQRPKLNSKLIEFFAEFSEVGDTITYTIDIKNKGTLDARLDSINFLSAHANLFEFECDNLLEGTVLKAGESMTTNLKIKYVKTNETTSNYFKNIKLVLAWEQDY